MSRQLEHFPNLVSMFFTRAAEKGDAPFLWAKSGGEWRSTSWTEAAEQVANLSSALTRLGLNPGDRVMLVAENRPEWLISDLAIMAAGCVTVPTYITNTERDHQHILDDSGARAVIVSTQKLAKTLLPAAVRSNVCEHVIGIEKLPAGQTEQRRLPRLVGADRRPSIPTSPRRRPARPSSAATSPASSTRRGTGGAPRGVMQHHGAILCNIEGCTDGHLRGFRLGRRGVPLLPPRQPRLRA